MGREGICYLVWRLMTGKKADYPRSKSQLEIQEKGARVWKLGIDDNCKLILMIDRWLTLRFVIVIAS